MSKVFTALLLFCAMTGLAQNPLLTSQWDQGYPYNLLCPADPSENYSHSYAGCPAIAMGQIINYLHTTQDTRFDDNDDYYANYAGRQFHIDDDWETYLFPSFPKLNVMLDSVDATYQRGEELSDSLAAAVIFACGVACTQVYTASSYYGSGTYSVNQAYEAYQRFGFTDCQLFQEPDSAMYATLIANLQAGYPAHLAVENSTGTTGHNIVVDGYREEDGKFHINFGWGGYHDDWYDIPDPNGFSYGWTKIEGIILNIIPTTSSIAAHEASRKQPLEVYPNPASDILFIKGLSGKTAEYAVFDVLGRKVAAGYTSGNIPVTDLEKGVYVLQIRGKQSLKFIVH